MPTNKRNFAAMELTAALLRQWFGAFNQQYFGGSLPEPRLEVSRSRTRLGTYSARRVRRGLWGYELRGHTIRVSDYYDMPEREYQQTLLHEMIHYYISHVRARDTSPHGQLFRAQAARINREGGWSISVSTRADRWPVRREHTERQYLLLAVEATDGKHYATVVNPAYRQYIDRRAADWALVSVRHWVVSTDAAYASWTKVRSLRLRRITADEYRRLTQ